MKMSKENFEYLISLNILDKNEIEKFEGYVLAELYSIAAEYVFDILDRSNSLKYYYEKDFPAFITKFSPKEVFFISDKDFIVEFNNPVMGRLYGRNYLLRDILNYESDYIPAFNMFLLDNIITSKISLKNQNELIDSMITSLYRYSSSTNISEVFMGNLLNEFLTSISPFLSENQQRMIDILDMSNITIMLDEYIKLEKEFIKTADISLYKRLYSKDYEDGIIHEYDLKPKIKSYKDFTMIESLSDYKKMVSYLNSIPKIAFFLKNFTSVIAV
jgi:hypothetical protein